jgi:hypothetical protein
MTPTYERVNPTDAELAKYRAKNAGRLPSAYRVRCRACGRRIWGSGMGIGSHNRACKGGKV